MSSAFRFMARKISSLKSALKINSAAAKPTRYATSSPLRRFSISRRPTELGYPKSLMPLHSSVAVVRMITCMGSSTNSAGYPCEELFLNKPTHGPVAILWNMESCKIPCDVRTENVSTNIRMTVRKHPTIQGNIVMFTSYGNVYLIPKWIREDCQRTGVQLVDVPVGRKDATNKAILLDMLLFVMDSPPPSTIMLISGDPYFASVLHILRQRGYTIILVIPSYVRVSLALIRVGTFVWDWHTVASGKDFEVLIR